MNDHKKHPSQSASTEDDLQQPIAAGDESQTNGGDTMPTSEPEEKALEEPTITLQDYQELQQELENSRGKIAENFEGWQRERADFMNYKKRIERDQVQTQQTMKGSIIKKFLPVVDDLDRALKNRPLQEEAAAWAEGFELIYRKLQNILESEGVQIIPAEGEMFDPNLHEAITHEDSPDHQSGQIIEVLQQGYTLGDRILRPALVRVAR